MSEIQAQQSSFPPIISPEDLVKLGVQSQRISSIISMASRAELSPNVSPPLSPSEVELVVEIFDQAMSSTAVDPSSKNRCFKVLRKVSPAHRVLPKSYFPLGVTSGDTIPYASGGFADIWKGQKDGNRVCLKAFRTQAAENLDKIKRRFYREVIGWKYVSHPNVLPFLGISETLFPFCIITPWLPNGNIVEYIRQHQGVNRLQLLAQAACGLEYLHSLNIVHSDINPGNILITEEDTACLADFGITGLITDPTVVEPGSTTTSKSGVVRYVAPEVLNPSQFSLTHSTLSKESDVFSFAMTAYEILTETLPYGNARDGVIIFHIVNGDRPPRPLNSRWLQDQVWDMITACWNQKSGQRWDIHRIYDQFSTSSIQEVPDIQTTTQTPHAVADAPTGDLSMRVEGPIPSNVPNTPKRKTPKRTFTLTLSRSGRNINREPRVDLGVQEEGTRKTATASRSWDRVRKMVDALRAFQRSRTFPGTDGRPS